MIRCELPRFKAVKVGATEVSVIIRAVFRPDQLDARSETIPQGQL